MGRCAAQQQSERQTDLSRTLAGESDIVCRQLEADPAACDFFSDLADGAGTSEGIEDQIAGPRPSKHTEFSELGREGGIVRRAGDVARNLPDIAAIALAADVRPAGADAALAMVAT